MAGRNPIVVGTVLALLAAGCFGAVTPFIQRLGAGLGAFMTAGLLYAGAVLGAALPSLARRGRAARRRDPRLRASHLPRLFLVAALGAALAPTLFAWGLQRVPATLGSLLLNLEAVFTIALAAAIHREHVGRRVACAGALMVVGGAVSISASTAGLAIEALGALALVGGVLFWSLDNALSRPLAELDPAAVVRGKAMIGVVLTFAFAVARREPAPESASQVLGLLACGATGYGLSLRLYLMAQRHIGAGRTGSVFAVAPFIGAAIAVALGDRSAGWTTLVAAALFAIAVVLHLSEHHGHTHFHTEMEHDHAHRHDGVDDDHHQDHAHEPPVVGWHSHPHRHAARTHAHAHAPDLHHLHEH